MLFGKLKKKSNVNRIKEQKIQLKFFTKKLTFPFQLELQFKIQNFEIQTGSKLPIEFIRSKILMLRTHLLIKENYL